MALHMFGIVLVSAGVFYGIVAIHVGHHHPDVLHDGDAIRYVQLRCHLLLTSPSMRLIFLNQQNIAINHFVYIFFHNSKSYDWGLYTVDTIMDRMAFRRNSFLALANFGDHVLHHLFPTFDHGILPHLYDTLFETLVEFEAESEGHPWFDVIKGQFLQLARVETNPIDSHQRYLLKMAKQKQQ